MITAISKNLKTKKYDIFFNGDFFGALSAASLIFSRLTCGQTLSAEALKSIIAEGELSDATADLMTALSRQSLTEYQAREKLLSKGYSDTATEHAIAKGKEYGYINDENYALRYIESCGNRKGKYRLGEELKQKGIDSAVIESALNGFAEYEGCYSALLTLMRIKKLDGGEKPDYAEKVKITRSLLYKGYSYETIKQAFAEFGCDTEQ